MSSQRMLILWQTFSDIVNTGFAKSRMFLSSQAACWCLYIIYYLMCCHTYRRANLGLILPLFLVLESQYCKRPLMQVHWNQGVKMSQTAAAAVKRKSEFVIIIFMLWYNQCILLMFKPHSRRSKEVCCLNYSEFHSIAETWEITGLIADKRSLLQLHSDPSRHMHSHTVGTNTPQEPNQCLSPV